MKPLRLPENCVWRIYTGGKLTGMWQGVDREDNHYPEDWVGSVITPGPMRLVRACPGWRAARCCGT